MTKHPPPSPAQQRRNPADDALERAEMALRMQRPAEAERLAAGVLKANRGHLAAATMLGRALLVQNRTDEAIAHLERTVRRSDDPSIGTLLARSLAAAGRRDEALTQLQQITGKNVAHPPAFREHVGQLSARGRVDDAIAVAMHGVALSPDAIELRMDLAALHLRRNDRTAARVVLLEARKVAPGRADVLAELGRLWLLDGDYASAADAYRHALALHPDNPMTRANFGVCQLEMGDRDAGEATLRAATRGRPEMLGRAIHSLAASSHGRFFLRPSAVEKFLHGGRP